MGKVKKFNKKNVEISAPILDPEIIKAIHSPPSRQRLDVRHGGFKALLGDPNSQDSTEEVSPLYDNYVPSYIGISCAVSGYTNYNSHCRRLNNSNDGKDQQPQSLENQKGIQIKSRARTQSPIIIKTDPLINHITIDRSSVQSPDDERKELTEKLTASANEHLRSSSPTIPPTELDRHHGAYVGARYVPLADPNSLSNDKPIPLLGIDENSDGSNNDDSHNSNNDKSANMNDSGENKKVEKSIASIYGDNFASSWRKSMSLRGKKHKADSKNKKNTPTSTTSPKDLVKLKSTSSDPSAENDENLDQSKTNMTGRAKNFFSRMFRSDNSNGNAKKSAQPTTGDGNNNDDGKKNVSVTKGDDKQEQQQHQETKNETQATNNNDNNTAIKQNDFDETPASNEALVSDKPNEHEHDLIEQNQPDIEQHDQLVQPESPGNHDASGLVDNSGEMNIEYEIRSKSPEDNQSSPVRIISNNNNDYMQQQQPESLVQTEDIKPLDDYPDEPLESQQEVALDQHQSSCLLNESGIHDVIREEPEEEDSTIDDQDNDTTTSTTQDGHYYLDLLNKEKNSISGQIKEFESLLGTATNETDDDVALSMITHNLNEESIGKIRSAIGKANLLITKKFGQFEGLCNSNIQGTAEGGFATLNQDLAGFWDMISIQVDQVKQSFENLLMSDEQQQQQQASITSTTSASSSKPKTKALSAEKDNERREKLKDHINRMKQNMATNENPTNADLLIDVKDSSPAPKLNEFD